MPVSGARRERGPGQLRLADTMAPGKEIALAATSAERAIEDSAFPFEYFADVAELESWRKEVHRPIYHIHKWWAQRLGSVFRAVLLGVGAPKGVDVLRLFYEPVRMPGAVVFDPFMGSGTTVGEALKLGARAIGRDINPVSHFIVRNALGLHPRSKLLETFHSIRRDIGAKLSHFYRGIRPDGTAVDVLYYFWVKVVPCPACRAGVDLFPSYVFSQHAYPSRYPDARILCPSCGAVNVGRFDAESLACRTCRAEFDPQAGPARGPKATCRGCGHSFPIAKTVKAGEQPPSHRLYAKMVLLPNGEKEYLAADDFDRELYEEAARELSRRKDAYPVVPIEPGYNTNQVLNYCYTHWHQMFNARQLLCLNLLAERIRAIPEENLRDLFACLFSGVLEFNNMFASFKGEGTGAVRHMFYHHILKPERTPLEANVWGTPKSSGSFTTLFESRILRAVEYAEDPFEIRVTGKNGKLSSEKMFGLSAPLGYEAAKDFQDFEGGKRLYLSCGDSANTDLADESVDAVVTDPPFFDNVHYSQLADFFFVWQRYVLGENGHHARCTTRSEAEVQQTDADVFAARLGGVWKECHRVLKPEGLLVFSYHHSRADGWRCVLEALAEAGFAIVAAHPMKAEMSVATPKHQAAEPIDLDMILVCRKRRAERRPPAELSAVIEDAGVEASGQVERLRSVGRRLSRNDVRVIVMAQVIKRLSWWPAGSRVEHLGAAQLAAEVAIDQLHGGPAAAISPLTREAGSQP
jgi:adenine-specific DNA methylase